MTLTAPRLDEVAAAVDALIDADLAASYKPHFNVAPTQPHPIVWMRGKRRTLTYATFGLPPLGRRPRLINIKGENVKPGSYEGRRCLIPVDGFYEWAGAKSDRKPIWFHRREGGVFFLAGVLETTDGRPAFAVLTTKPNAVVSPVHDRMPAILSPASWSEWLDGAGRDVLAPAPEPLLTATAVSPRVNSPQNDDASLLEPA